MYPSSETSIAALESGLRRTETGQVRESFRPVALPALCAAFNVKAPAKAAKRDGERRVERRGILGMIHEDAPLL